MSKPKILIALYAYEPFANANTNVMMPLIRELKNEYEIHIVTMNYGKEKAQECIDGVTVHRYKRPKWVWRIFYALQSDDININKNTWKKWIWKIFRPMIRLTVSLDWFPHPEYVLLRELISLDRYQFVLSTCEYYLSNINVLRLKQRGLADIPWFSYFMDPHANFIGNEPHKAAKVELEHQVYKFSDIIFVTEEIYKENKTNTFQQYLHKTHPVRYGNFKILNCTSTNEFFDRSKVNFVFAGSLLDVQIRDPRYFYEIINHANHNYLYHIIVNHMSPSNTQLKNEVLTNLENTRWYDTLPLNTCLQLMCGADVLVNLGNKSLNQTPSKIFDYMGTGKPIINFYSRSDDTSKYYLERYPKRLNVFEDFGEIDENEAIIDQFVAENMDTRIADEELLGLYGNYTGNQTAKETVQLINEYLGGDNDD